MNDRVTRELTPNMEVMNASSPLRSRLICALENAEVLEEDGRAVLHVAEKGAGKLRFLLDTDADLYSLLCCTDQDILRRTFEVHLTSEELGTMPRALIGPTVLLPQGTAELPAQDGAVFGLKVNDHNDTVPPGLDEVHMHLQSGEDLLEDWPVYDAPLVVTVDLDAPGVLDILSPFAHGMGSGRYPVRELRLRVDPRVYLTRGQRPPFLSEILEAVAVAVGCDPISLMRELALRGRLMPRGMRRHLVPDPAFVTWTFRSHRLRGLVPVTDHFPVPKRASHAEILRGTPESERERLLSYLSLLEDTAPRARAFEKRDLFAISVHFLDNPELPLPSPHGGITVWDKEELRPLFPSD